MSMPPLGSGGRFAALEGKLSHDPSVHNPAALAASIGRAKYGGHKMGMMAQHGTGAAGLPNHPMPGAVQHHVMHHIMHHLFGG
jgi:hypothetical protein